MKKICTHLLAFLLVLFFVFGGTGCTMEHIEDTNGADNYTLQTITDENIIHLDMGSLGVNESWDSITNITTYSSKKFSGVYEIFGENVITNRYEIILNHARVDEGNFRMVVVINDEIVHEFVLNELTQSVVLTDVRGYLSLRIAGESAKFMFDYYII